MNGWNDRSGKQKREEFKSSFDRPTLPLGEEYAVDPAGLTLKELALSCSKKCDPGNPGMQFDHVMMNFWRAQCNGKAYECKQPFPKLPVCHEVQW